MIGLAFSSRVVAVVTVVLALSACTSRVGGVPIADPDVPPVPEELTAEFVFDDLTTVAPCSLTDPEVFSDFGEASFATPEALDYCAIRVNTPGDADVVISIGSFGVLDAQPDLQDNRVKDVDGGLWIGQQDPDPSFCSQLLVFADDVTMQVAGTIYDGTADTCPMVEAGMDKAVEVILDKGVEQRDPEGNSLLTVDPCSLVEDSDITAIPGLTGARQPNEYPGRHTCYWEVPGGPTTVRLEFGAGVAPTPYAQGATEGLVAGRQTTTNPLPEVGENSYCAVATGHIDFDEIEGEDAVEQATVYVRMPAGQVAAGCAAATAVAGLVWPELPSA